MTVKKFDSYLDRCKICNKGLSLTAEFDLLTHVEFSPTSWDMQVAGTLVYVYQGDNKFVKECTSPDMDGATAEEAFNVAVNSFTVGKRVYPHLGRTRIVKAIDPTFIDAIPMTLTKSCSDSSGHIYGYKTNIINEWDTSNQNILDISYEFLQAHEYQISNRFQNNKPASTKIIDFSNRNVFDTIELPLIPIDKWNISSREAMKKQIEKMTILS